MEARIFFPLVGTNQSNAPFDLASPTTTLAICSQAPNFFGSSTSNEQQDASDKIVAAFSSSSTSSSTQKKQKPELRNDLYLVLPPTSGGSCIGFKWRGQSESFLLALNGQEPNKSVNNSSEAQAILQSKIVNALLQASAEVKITAMSSSSVSKPLPSQAWTKYEVNKFETVAVCRPNETALDVFFAACLSKTLEKLTKNVDSSHAQPLMLAAAALAAYGCCSPSATRPFALVSVDKRRIKTAIVAAKTSWDLEQADLQISDVTSMFFIPSPAQQEKHEAPMKQIFRTVCVEPDVFWGKDDKKYVDLGGEFIQSCAKIDPANCKVAAYPQFLAESFFA